VSIKPIETWYGGCRFRSRLEARWAVFFDQLTIRWEYEAQGYELPSGARYLPDFWLPDENFAVEVKGDEKAFRDESPRYAEAVQTRSIPGLGLLFLGPVPDAAIKRPLHLAVAAEEHCCGDTILGLRAVDFEQLTLELGGDWPTPGTFLGLHTDRRSHDPMRLPTLGHLGRVYNGYIGGGAYPPEWTTPYRLAEAYRLARSARFEHGELPPRPRGDEGWPPVAKPGGDA
jgi:hypothetical protein